MSPTMRITYKVVTVNINDNGNDSQLINCMVCGSELTVSLNYAPLMT